MSYYNVQAIHHVIVVVVTRVGLNLQHNAVGTQRDPPNITDYNMQTALRETCITHRMARLHAHFSHVPEHRVI